MASMVKCGVECHCCRPSSSMTTSTNQRDPKEYHQSGFYRNQKQETQSNANQVDSVSFDVCSCSGSECCYSSISSNSYSIPFSSSSKKEQSKSFFIEFPRKKEESPNSFGYCHRQSNDMNEPIHNETYCSLAKQFQTEFEEDLIQTDLVDCCSSSSTDQMMIMANGDHHLHCILNENDNVNENDGDLIVEQWALISNEFQLNIQAQENYVGFIGADAQQCHLLITDETDQNHSIDENKRNCHKIDGRQAVLIYTNGSFHLKDLNSSFGTYINDRRVPSRCFVKLNEHDHIRFGFNTDVYQLKRIKTNIHSRMQQQIHHHRAQTSYSKQSDNLLSSVENNLPSNSIDQLSNRQTSPPISPMNKLFRIKSGSRKKNDNKNDSSTASADKNHSSSSCSKLSPSSFSLMSSSSNSSSTSTSSSTTAANNHHQPTSPSSVFMSAVKKMKMRFKKKSSSNNNASKDNKKSSSLICSGNDDITFIRYDNHHQNQQHNHIGIVIAGNHHQPINHPPPISLIGPHSVSAPESPNQSHSRIYHSHTYQNEYHPHGRKLSAYQMVGITFEEHEYDEVTREDQDEDDIEEDIATNHTTSNSACSCVSDQPSSNNTTNDDHRLLSSLKSSECCHDAHLDDEDHDDDNGTLCRKICNSPTNALNATIINDDDDDDDFDTNSDNILLFHDDHHNNTVQSDMNTATPITTTTNQDLVDLVVGDDVDDDDDDEELSSERIDMVGHNVSSPVHSSTSPSSTTTKGKMLPHLNSEDRLNNNSSLDTNAMLDVMLLTSSTNVQDSLIKKCEKMNITSCQSMDNSSSSPSSSSLKQQQPLDNKNIIIEQVGEEAEAVASSHYQRHSRLHNNRTGVQHMDADIVQLPQQILDTTTTTHNQMMKAQHKLTSASSSACHEIVVVDDQQQQNIDDNFGVSSSQSASLVTTSKRVSRSSVVLENAIGSVNFVSGNKANLVVSSQRNNSVIINRCTNNDCDHLGATNHHSTTNTVCQENSEQHLFVFHEKPSPSASNNNSSALRRDKISSKLRLDSDCKQQPSPPLICYDIDDIGHLRRQSFNNESMSNTLANKSSNVVDQQLARQNGGGLAFVINFEDDQQQRPQPPSLLHNRLRHNQNINSSDNEPKQPTTQNMIRLNNKRSSSRNMIINNTSNNNPNTNVDYGTSPTQSHQQPQESHTAPPTSMKRSDTFDKKIVNNRLQDDQTKQQSLVQQPTTTKQKEDRGSPLLNSHQNSMKKHSLDATISDASTSSCNSSSARRQKCRNGTGGAQLSESAVYLINRMFEDNDYHHRCCTDDGGENDSSSERHNGGTNINHHQYDHHHLGGYGPHDHNSYNGYDRSRSHQSVSLASSGSDSPYGIRSCSMFSNQTMDHIPTNSHHQQQQPHQHMHHHHHHACNSSNASTRMEYDDSLSSLHSNSDSAQRSSLTHLQQSMATIVPSSPQSTLDKQVDSAIDDIDGDLIPDDISETGTYVVEIDEQGHKHHRKHSVINNNKNKNKKNTIKNNNGAPTKPNDNEMINVRSDADDEDGVDDDDDDLAGVETNSDYEDDEDFDYEEVDDNDQDDEEGEDKLEAARKQIDELFSNYEKNQTQQQQMQDNNGIFSTNNFTNNATFTRCKRGQTSTAPYNNAQQHHKQNSSRVDDKCPSQIADIDPPRPSKMATFTDKTSSKKRISSELMSAFKRINSKLEKTARLGKLSLADSPNNNTTTTATTINLQSDKFVTDTKPPLKCRSAPATPILSLQENRKKLTSTNANRIALSRKASFASSNEYSSNEKLNDEQHSLNADNITSRARSESISSTTSNQSSNLRFNRAFALRRARLGMDTCGVDISEQAANKAKESHNKSQPPKKPQMTFRRNDGGRFSLRVPDYSSRASSGSRTGQIGIKQVVSAANKQTPNTGVRKSSKPPTSPAVNVTKIPTIKSYSTSSSVCSSTENLSSSTKKHLNESRLIRHNTCSKQRPQPPTTEHNKISAKISHSDNEVGTLDGGGDSSCDESSPFFNRFGGHRLSLRGPSSINNISNSTPWLKSLKQANSPNVAKNNLIQSTQQPQASYPLFGSTSGTTKSSSGHHHHHHHRHSSNHHPSHSESETTELMNDPVRPNIPSFQVGKRFFSTKPHRMAQFDKEFNIVARSASVNSQQQITPDPNLMTHSVTESLLSRPNPSNHVQSIKENQSNEHPAGVAATSAISSSINARIFSISPLDSLVISAINQLSSKLRTRMRDFLERERSNHLVGSEARSLIDEILPQVSTVSGSDSRSISSKSAFNHESSNISRDLSNILKNLKKVEQIFDVFYMLLEPNVNNNNNNSQNISTSTGRYEHGIMTNDNNNDPIITNVSDSDTSGGEGPANVSSSSGHSSLNHNNDIKIVKQQTSNGSVVIKPINRFMQHQQQQSPPTPPSSSQSSRTGFFIEI